jgi:hypothetical protein
LPRHCPAGDPRRSVAHRGVAPSSPRKKVWRLASLAFYFLCFAPTPLPGEGNFLRGSRGRRSDGGMAQPINPARPRGHTQQRQPNGNAKNAFAFQRLNPGAKRPRARRAGSPHNARRKTARRAKCAWGTSPAHRLALPPPCASRSASQGNGNCKPTALRASTRGQPPRPAGGCLPPGPPSNRYRTKATPGPGGNEFGLVTAPYFSNFFLNATEHVHEGHPTPAPLDNWRELRADAQSLCRNLCRNPPIPARIAGW